jgi:metacaspase-1
MQAQSRRPRAFVRVLPILFLIGAATPLFGETYALLIGIDKYPHARQLKGAVNDIKRIRTLVTDDLKIPESNVHVLLEEQATKANILAALDHFATETKAGDTIFWYYSGHGWVQNDLDGDEALLDPDDKLDEVLVPYDAVPWPRERALEPNPTMVVDDEIGLRLNKLIGRRWLIIFDSCHSGTATRGLPGENETRSLYPNYPLPPTPKTRSLRRNTDTMDVAGQVIFIAAASPVEAASDMGDFDGERHGALTAGLLRAIKQAGPNWPASLSWERIFQIARDDMVNHGFPQTPSITATRGIGKLTVEQVLHPPAANEIASLQTSGAFEVQLGANQYIFEDGELLEVAVESARDGYLYLFDVNADEEVTQLLPNRFSPMNRITAGGTRQVPTKSDTYQFRAGKPFGRSTVVAVVTTTPWEQADALKLPTGFEPLEDRKKDGLRSLLRALQDGSSATWASQRIVVEIHGKGVPPSPSAALAQPAAAAVVTSAQVPVAPPTPPPSVGATAPVAATPTPLAAPAPPSLAPPPSTPAALSLADSLDDSNLPPEVQADLPHARPALFAKLKALAERFSPIFWQDVGGEWEGQFRPWRDFIVRFDFDQTKDGPNWPAPQNFQDQNKRARISSLNALLAPDPLHVVTKESPSVFRVEDKAAGETYQLDLHPTVYWAVLATRTDYFFHYLAFHGEDWKPLFGHTGDFEGTTIVVDRQTEKMVCAFTLAHDDVGVVRGLDDEPEANIGILVNPAAEARDLFDGADGRPVDGSLAMNVTRDGEPAPKEHQDIYVESRGHGQYGPFKIHPSHYVIYGTFFPEETWVAPSLDRAQYPLADKIADIPSKHKYKLEYIGAGPSPASRGGDGAKSLWGEYKELSRFPGGVNPPWDWRDSLFFKTGWWKDPRMIKKIGSGEYLLNPYLIGSK